MKTYYGHVDTRDDAILLLEACRTGFLPRSQSQLSKNEQGGIRSGFVYVWDENETGIKRWTDGKKWSCTVMSGDFMIYREITNQGSEKSQNHDEATSNYKDDGLVKRLFSIATSEGRLMHLISYTEAAGSSSSSSLLRPTQDKTLDHIKPSKEMYPKPQPEHPQQKISTLTEIHEIQSDKDSPSDRPSGITAGSTANASSDVESASKGVVIGNSMSPIDINHHSNQDLTARNKKQHSKGTNTSQTPVVQEFGNVYSPEFYQPLGFTTLLDFEQPATDTTCTVTEISPTQTNPFNIREEMLGLNMASRPDFLLDPMESCMFYNTDYAQAYQQMQIERDRAVQENASLAREIVALKLQVVNLWQMIHKLLEKSDVTRKDPLSTFWQVTKEKVDCAEILDKAATEILGYDTNLGKRKRCEDSDDGDS